jgi:hypothetical protein
VRETIEDQQEEEYLKECEKTIKVQKKEIVFLKQRIIDLTENFVVRNSNN